MGEIGEIGEIRGKTFPDNSQLERILSIHMRVSIGRKN